MAGVPHDLVLGGVIDVVERDRQLHRSQRPAKVAAVLRDHFQDALPDLLREQGEPVPSQELEVLWGADSVEHGTATMGRNCL